MAGIGFELRKLMRAQTYSGLLRSYGYAGLISSGPWILSILAVMALGLVSFYGSARGHPQGYGVDAFLVSVTYLVAVSLVATGLVQLVFTRFVADRLFLNDRASVLPNLIGLLILVNLLAGLFAGVIILTLFDGTPYLYRVEMFTGFVLLCDVWVLSVFLSGMKAYRAILWCFAAGYGTVFGGGLLLREHGLFGLMGAFCVGQAVLMFALLWLVLRDYPSDRLVRWEAIQVKFTHPTLIFIGLFYNVAIWVDKFMFWYTPDTSVAVIGPLRASPIYDFPIFLAYLSIIPGMAVFLTRMETDFAEAYDHYYNAIRNGDTLEHIENRRAAMIESVRQGIYDIFKIQGITVAVLLAFAGPLMRLLGFSEMYVPLFDIDIVGVGVQVLFLAILNTLFYLDKLRIALILCLIFAVGNCLLTGLSQWLGVSFYGYGFALSVSIASLVGLGWLSSQFDRLTYRTFMFQPAPRRVPEHDAPKPSGKTAPDSHAG